MAVSTLSGLIWRTEPAWAQRAWRVTALRRGWLRPARLCEPQLHHPILRSSSSARPPRAANASPSPRTAIPLGIALFALSSSGRSLRGPKRASRVAGLRGGRLRPARLYEPQEHSPKLAPVLRPVSASLRLRFRSATFAVARWDFISILLTAKRVKSLFTRAGDRTLRGSSFFARPRDSSIFG